ncbi:hypothetical protein [Desulfitobacterium hafniense]|uniref:hypothetical protein n=1 Tax=Desulfitobacterium hafniense TaxID=49338 RepID=UPI00036FD4E3|nr:hypothetical protein [Desulfitobacterium hafniense]
MGLSILEAEARTNRHKATLDQAKGKRDLLLAQKAQKEAELAKVTENIATWEQVQLLLSHSSQYAREQLKQKIEETVTAALRSIFEEPIMEFKVELQQSSNGPSARWRVRTMFGGEYVEIDPEEGHGGGLVDVVSMALRLSLLELARPKHEGPVILDEPGKMISQEYLPNVALFLKRYAEKTGRQIIMVTHHRVLADAADAAWYVWQENKVSRAKRIGGED